MDSPVIETGTFPMQMECYTTKPRAQMTNKFRLRVFDRQP